MCVPTGKVITQLLFRRKFPLSKVRVITSGSVPPVLPPAATALSMWGAPGTFCSWLGACLGLTALLTQGKAWHNTWASPRLWERKHNLVGFCPLSSARPSIPVPTGIATGIRQCCLWEWSQSIDHLPLPFHTVPFIHLPQKLCWAFPHCRERVEREDCWQPCCIHVLPELHRFLRQVYILLHLYIFGVCMHWGILLCSLEISNDRGLIFLVKILNLSNP